jgi:hypothetical protein
LRLLHVPFPELRHQDLRVVPFVLGNRREDPNCQGTVSHASDTRYDAE